MDHSEALILVEVVRQIAHSAWAKVPLALTRSLLISIIITTNSPLPIHQMQQLQAIRLIMLNSNRLQAIWHNQIIARSSERILVFNSFFQEIPKGLTSGGKDYHTPMSQWTHLRNPQNLAPAIVKHSLFFVKRCRIIVLLL